MPRADCGREIEQSHGLDRIGRLEGCARFRVGRFENLVDFVQQRLDDLDRLAVLLRCRCIIAREVSLVTLGIDRLRARKAQTAPALHGAAFQRIHFGQQFAEDFLRGRAILDPLVAAAQVLHVFAEIDRGLLLLPGCRRLRFLRRLRVGGGHGSRLFDRRRQQEDHAEQEQQQNRQADPQGTRTDTAGRGAARGSRRLRRTLQRPNGLARLDHLVARAAGRGDVAPGGRRRGIAEFGQPVQNGFGIRPARCVLREHLSDQRLQSLRNRRAVGRHQWRRLFPGYVLGRRRGTPGRTPADQFVNQAAEREDVVRGIGRIACELLRTGRNERATARILAAGRGHSEIDQVRRAVVVEQDIGGFHIPVYHPFRMRVTQCVRDQGDRRQRVGERCAGQDADVRPVDELQAVEPTVVFVELECANDVRVHQANRELPLAPQRLDADAIVHQDLERNGRAGDPVRRKPGFRRAPSAQAAD